jgi:hypothetical protein
MNDSALIHPALGRIVLSARPLLGRYAAQRRVVLHLTDFQIADDAMLSTLERSELAGVAQPRCRGDDLLPPGIFRQLECPGTSGNVAESATRIPIETTLGCFSG